MCRRKNKINKYKKIGQDIEGLKEQKIFNPQKLRLSRQIQFFVFKKDKKICLI